MKTRMLSVLVVLAVLVVGFMMGCATYSTRGAVPMMNRIEENKLVKMEKDGVAVTAFPILDEDDAKKYFDENIIGDRFLAVYLNVSNKTSNEVRVISSELRIGQTVLQPSTADEMYKVVKREYFGKAFLWMLPTYFVGAPVSAIHTFHINTKIEEDIKEKQLDFGKEIRPMETSQGFVWFKIPKKIAPEYKDKGLPKGTVLNLILEQEKRVVEYKLLMP